MNNMRLSNTLVMISGTLGAQIIFVAVTPLLTRIYSVSEIGVFGLYMSLILVAGKLVNLRYDLAVPIARTDDQALNSIVLSITVGTFITLVFFLTFYIFGISNSVFELMGSHILQGYLIVLITGILLYVYHETLTSWLIRNQQFHLLAFVRISNAFVLGVVQLVGYWFTAKIPFLLGAHVISQLVGITLIVTKSLQIRDFYENFNVIKLFQLAKEHYRFPRYSTLGSVSIELNAALPIVALTYLRELEACGYFFMARRIGLLPSSVVGRSISQVSFSEMMEQKTLGTLLNEQLKQIRKLQWILFVPAIMLAWIAPVSCSAILGNDWEIVGYYLQYMAPFVYIRIIYSPSYAIPYVMEYQRMSMYAEIIITTSSMIVLCVLTIFVNVDFAIMIYFFTLGIVTIVFRLYLLNRLGASIFGQLYPTFIQSVFSLMIYYVLKMY